MSIGAANLFTRNIWKAWVNPAVTSAGEAQVAKITSLLVKVGALLAILFLPTQFALDLQLLGGLWILQTFPALVFGLFVNWFGSSALLAGWAVGLFGGSLVAWMDGLRPLHSLTVGETTFSVYTGVLALLANIIVAVLVNVALKSREQAALKKSLA